MDGARSEAGVELSGPVVGRGGTIPLGPGESNLAPNCRFFVCIPTFRGYYPPSFTLSSSLGVGNENREPSLEKYQLHSHGHKNHLSLSSIVVLQSLQSMESTRQMSSINFKSIVAGESPRERHKYILLDSPKSGTAIHPKLPFLVILSLVIGIILGGTWNKIDARTDPCTQSTRSSGSLDGYLLRNQHGNDPFSIQGSNISVNRVDSQLHQPNVNTALSIAWLMSFPNSGTSYTSYLVRTVTGKNTASNYGRENLGRDGTSIPVFNDSPGGPFWSDPMNKLYVRPDRGYLLTKTHCGGRCDLCPPEEYIEDLRIFSNRCVEGYHIINDTGSGDKIEIFDNYSKDLVARAVHLIRDPFDNIVSRFHLTYKHFVRSNDTDMIAAYPRSREGFRAYCKDLGDQFYEEERATKEYSGLFEDVKKIPCHSDFFMYIQWHNLAFITTWDLNIPTLVIHYENYTHSFNQTKDILLEFLGHESIYEPPIFETGKTYRDYFTDDEVRAVANMFSKLAHSKTRTHTMHYFV